MKKLTTALLFLVMLTQGAAYAAANFDFGLLNGTVLPSNIPAGGTVTIYLVVTNKSRIYLKDYVVSGVPPSVQQITSSPIVTPYPICTNPIDLRATKSCLLILKISQPINTKFALCNKFACTTSGIPLNFKQVNNSPGIAVGAYVATGGLYPLIVHSAGGTDPWSYVVDSTPSTIPADLVPSFGDGFLAAACSGQNCLAGGDYDSSIVGTIAPLLGVSADGGATWNYPPDIITLLAGLNYQGAGEFVSVAISGSRAAAVGSYTQNVNIITYLFAESNDSGSTWTYSSVVPPDFDATNTSVYFGAACNSTICLAAGFYNNSPVLSQYLLLTIPDNPPFSQVPIDSSNAPSNIMPGLGANSFTAAGCSDTVCAAAGNYHGSLGLNYPVIAESTGTFQTWTYEIDDSSPLPPNYAGNFTSLVSLSCSGASCVAVGNYNDTIFNNNQPLMYVRSGGTWSLNTSIINLFPVDTIFGEFLSVSCSGNTCVTVGDYGTLTTFLPIVLVSQDAGLTWTVPTSILNFPQDSNQNIQFNSVTCSGQNCIIAGNYKSLLGFFSPLVVESTDGGVTWTYAVYSTSPPLPSDFDSFGGFSGTGIPGVLQVKVPKRL